MNQGGLKDHRVDPVKAIDKGKMARPKATLVLIAQSSQRWHSLQRLLRTIPEVGVLYHFNDLMTLWGSDPPVSPTLLLVDFAMPDATFLKALPQIRARWPQARLIALTEHEGQAQQAEAAGIQISLPEGVLAATVWETIAALLLETGYDYDNPSAQNV